MSIMDFGPIASFLGRGTASITVPTLDGALRPNDLLETAPVFAEHPGADTLVASEGRLLLSAENKLLAISKDGSETIAEFDCDITALAASGAAVAVGLASGRVEITGGPHDGKHITEAEGKPLKCPTALLINDDRMIIADGSDLSAPEDWARDLLERNVRGRVLSINLQDGQQQCLANKVAYANGLAETADRNIVVSQSWRHCLSLVSNLKETASPCHNLPGYPSRISNAADGGYWLAIFGMRTQLIEFVLREHQYRKRMMATVPPEYWIAPALVSRSNFLDPLQQGTVKQLGIQKPWAPPRSYGLVVKLDQEFQPQFSLHSRVGGNHHGVTSAAEMDGTLYVASKGAGLVLAVDLATVEQEIVQ